MAKKQSGLFDRIGQRAHQLRQWIEIKISRWRYGVIDPAYDLRELHLLERVQPGELVYCEMPLSDWELASIPVGHRCRPYLVVEKTETGIIGFPCSHKPYHKDAKWSQLHLFSQDHRMFLFFGDERWNYSDSYISFSRLARIQESKMLSRTQQLDESDRSRADRILAVLAGRGRLPQRWQLNQEAPAARPGDLLHQGDQIVLVSSCDHGTIYAFPVEKGRSKKENGIEIECMDHTRWHLIDCRRISILLENAGPVISFCATEQLLKAEQAISVLKRKGKASTRPAKNAIQLDLKMRFRAQPGELFLPRYQDGEWIYLFSRGNKDYFVMMSDYYNETFDLHKDLLARVDPACELIDPMTYEEVIEGLVGRSFLDRPAASRLKESFYKAWRESDPDMEPWPLPEENQQS